MSRRGSLIILAVLLAYLATGLAIVQQDEIGVVRRFGAVQPEVWPPGLHWGLPWGLGKVDAVKIGQTRTITVGVQTTQSPLAGQGDAARDEFLTGDLDLVTIQAVLQYRVAEPALHLFTSTSVERSLLLAAESALTGTLAERGIDDLLTVGRAEAADQVAQGLRPWPIGKAWACRSGRCVWDRLLLPLPWRRPSPTPRGPVATSGRRSRWPKNTATARRPMRGAGSGKLPTAPRGRRRPRPGGPRRSRSIREDRGRGAQATRCHAATALPETMGEVLPRMGRKMIVQKGQDLDLSVFTDREGPAGASPAATPKAPRAQ